MNFDTGAYRCVLLPLIQAASFAKGNSSFTVTLESGEKQYATFTQPLTNSWQEYKFTLVTPADVKVTDEARLRVSFAQPGDYLLSVSRNAVST